MKRTIILCVIMLMTMTCTFAQNKKELQTTIDQLNTKVAEQAKLIETQTKLIETLQSQLTTANNTITSLQQTMEAKKNGALVSAKDSIADVIVKYRACEEWEERLQYVMEPERIKPIMQKRVAKNGYSSKELEMKTIKNGIVKLKDNLYVTKGIGIGGYYVVKTNEGYKVDWEATVEYNPIEVLELENMPGKTIEWRGDFKIASIYENEWYRDFFDLSSGQHMFTKKGTKVDKDMFEIMKDGEYHSIIVKVKRTTDSDGDSFYDIVEVVSNSMSKY